jgi:uncharacterized protein
MISWVVLMLLCLALLWGTRGWQKRAGATLISRGAALLYIGFSLLDAGLVNALRPLDVSFGPTELAFLGLGVIRLFLAVSLVFSQRRAALGQTLIVRGRAVPRSATLGLAVLLVLNLGLVAVEVDGLYLEPQSLSVTQLTLPGPALAPGRPLRILQLTDLHIERLTHREHAVLASVAALQPDLIVLTGDYLNEEYLGDPVTRQTARDVLAQLHAPQGVYAVSGTIDPPDIMAALFDGLDITVLDDAVHRLSLAGGDVYLMGVSNLQWARGTAGDGVALKRLMQTVPAGAYSVLLYHTPDLIDTASALGVNLYLAGHTHGGQIRLPFYGALITFSAYGRRYQMGRYTLGPTTLYVSRGLGMEGLGLPRVRLLCPPEVDVISLASP